MSVNHQNSLQDQINKLEIEVAQLGGLVKALLYNSKQFSNSIKSLDDFGFKTSNRVKDIEELLNIGKEIHENHRDASEDQKEKARFDSCCDK